MELAFNELSQIPLLDDKYQANERMIQFSKAVAEARKNGFRKIRTHYSASEIKLTQDYTLHNWLFDKEFSAENRALFFDMFVQPFLGEDDEDLENRFVDANYFFEDVENQIPKQECLGLTAAYLIDTLAISFQSSDAWLKNQLIILVENEAEIFTENVHNIFSKECFNQNSIADFVESTKMLDLEETPILPNNKHFHLTAHHGQQELTELWNRIKNSPYVIGGMSIEWGGNSFYKKPQRNGRVDIVHLKSDRRYAMQIQTTGNNLRETIEISKRLAEKYG